MPDASICQTQDLSELPYGLAEELNKLRIELARQFDINKRVAEEAAETEERTRLMLDAAPLCSMMWTRDYRVIDCNKTTIELFEMRNKRELLEKFLTFNPEYQPNGHLSAEEGHKYIDLAFNKGGYHFDWSHIMHDGTLLPMEVTLVRVRYKGEHVVVAFAKDLRQIKRMEKNILWLESESEKIYYDPLTGIYNRRYFDEGLARVLHALSRTSGKLGLMMVDIDFFKNYNDTYGHSAGDDCLRVIAETIKSSAGRAEDFVARYGGDEFAVVLPNTDESGACSIAERILENVRNTEIPHVSSSVSSMLTVSIGVTSGTVRQMHTVDVFIQRADELLYKAKQSGRNRYDYGYL